MKAPWIRIAVLAALAWPAVSSLSGVHAQEATERYIPIGKSPGLSGAFTVIGVVDSVDVKRGTLTCVDPQGAVAVTVDEDTKLWLDRSKRGLTNVPGLLGYCRRGHVIEVKFRDNDRRARIAEWIKVESAE